MQKGLWWLEVTVCTRNSHEDGSELLHSEPETGASHPQRGQKVNVLNLKL